MVRYLKTLVIKQSILFNKASLFVLPFLFLSFPSLKHFETIQIWIFNKILWRTLEQYAIFIGKLHLKVAANGFLFMKILIMSRQISLDSQNLTMNCLVGLYVDITQVWIMSILSIYAQQCAYTSFIIVQKKKFHEFRLNIRSECDAELRLYEKLIGKFSIASICHRQFHYACFSLNDATQKRQ